MIAKINNDYVKVVYDYNTRLYAVSDQTYTGSSTSLKGLERVLNEKYGNVIIPSFLFARKLKNLATYIEAINAGYDYAINLNTNEMHKLSILNFEGAHNIPIADFSDFIFVEDIGTIRIEDLPEGFTVPIFIFGSNEMIDYKINKCKYCYREI